MNMRTVQSVQRPDIPVVHFNDQHLLLFKASNWFFDANNFWFRKKTYPTWAVHVFVSKVIWPPKFSNLMTGRDIGAFSSAFIKWISSLAWKSKRLADHYVISCIARMLAVRCLEQNVRRHWSLLEWICVGSLCNLLQSKNGFSFVKAITSHQGQITHPV